MKNYKHLFTLILSLFFAGSTVLFAQDTDEKKIPEAPYGLGSLEIFSIFSSSHKTKDYEMALMYGRWLMLAHPKTMEGLPQYDGSSIAKKMIDVYTEVSKKQKDPTLKSAYLDSAAQIFDNVLTIFTDDKIDRFRWIMDRGRFYQTNADFIDNGYGKMYDDYYTIFEMDSKRTTELGKGYYVKITLQNLLGKGEKEKALDVIEKSTPFASEDLFMFFDEIQDNLFSNPAERVIFLEGKLKEDPRNLALIQEIFGLYEKLDDKEMSLAYANKLYELDPNIENILRLADVAKKNANHKKAIELFNEALKIAKTDDQKKELYIDLADVYQAIDNLKKARDYAKKANAIDSKWGTPYMKLASIYAQAVNDCAGGQMTRQDKVVYWLVLDYLEAAKANDPTSANTVTSQIRAYEPVTPTVEEKFYMSWNAGDRIKVDGTLKECYSWINEWTKVR